jgi:hypothetical protein
MKFHSIISKFTRSIFFVSFLFDFEVPIAPDDGGTSDGRSTPPRRPMTIMIPSFNRQWWFVWSFKLALYQSLWFYRYFNSYLAMLATGVTTRADINGNDGHSEAPIQQQIVSLSNRMITGNAAGGCVNVVEGGRRRVARFEGYLQRRRRRSVVFGL